MYLCVYAYLFSLASSQSTLLEEASVCGPLEDETDLQKFSVCKFSMISL